jgi:small ligand-binding sensory domain FIST
VTNRFATAMSVHPRATHAVGEVVGEIIEAVGSEPDVLVIFFSGSHVESAGVITSTVNTLLHPRHLIGSSTSAAIAGSYEAEGRDSVALWAMWTDAGDSISPVVVVPGGTGRLEALGFEALDHGSTVMLLADPFSVPIEQILGTSGLTIVGGLASSASRPGENRLVSNHQRLAGSMLREGAVGVVFAPGLAPRTAVSQGCRSFGQPFTITKARDNLILELAGVPALVRVIEMLENADPDTRALAARGLHCGLVIDESVDELRRGDFLIRDVLGADRESGALAISDQVEAGHTVQLHVRDAQSASDDLTLLLADVAPADAAMLFTGNARGLNLFSEANHDAERVTDICTTGAVAGMYCAGELGPVRGRNALHGFTASVALFDH